MGPRMKEPQQPQQHDHGDGRDERGHKNVSQRIVLLNPSHRVHSRKFCDLVQQFRPFLYSGMKRRLANLPLHGGKAPPWLFRRMTRLAGAVTMAIVDEFGPDEMLSRLSDPWWFQAFGCVLGFDWHSSGVTTVTCGALKEAFKRMGPDLGICVAGGKGERVDTRLPRLRPPLIAFRSTAAIV